MQTDTYCSPPPKKMTKCPDGKKQHHPLFLRSRADQAVKMRQQLENMNSANEEQCDKLETQLKEDKVRPLAM